MDNSKTKATWIEVNTNSLSEQLAKQHKAFKDAAEKAAKARTEFNTAFIAAAKKAGKVPQGHTLLISHNFGKLSVSIIKDEDAKRSKSGNSDKPQFSF